MFASIDKPSFAEARPWRGCARLIDHRGRHAVPDYRTSEFATHAGAVRLTTKAGAFRIIAERESYLIDVHDLIGKIEERTRMGYGEQPPSVPLS